MILVVIAFFDDFVQKRQLQHFGLVDELRFWYIGGISEHSQRFSALFQGASVFLVQARNIREFLACVDV
jgi:hypothetical protein